jgi:hypothetical protein
MILPLLPSPRQTVARIERISAHYDMTTMMIAAPHKSMNSMLVKKTSTMSDESTCSVTSAPSSMSSLEGRTVHFSEEVTVYVAVAHELTRREVRDLWLSRRELVAIRERVRRESHLLLRRNPLYIQAVEHMQTILARRNLYAIVDLDEVCKATDLAERQQCSIDVAAARILVASEGRGLERVCAAHIMSIHSTRSINHIQRHAMTILDTQALLQHCCDDERTQCIAELCHSESSVTWARMMAEADAESVRMDDSRPRSRKSLVELKAAARQFRLVAV